ncbi:hypothetical protein [Paenibacillus sacheonensis]|uniref:Fibronectin type-III domain-containing protein n=1 Tax=Paenibacillus sacheonensis TaxID=742054 RepID=A0A7X5C471_9BACL|nr:hypothetical protein [Paenibacillus sacheonensis]MBM7568379.1 hypothetical protein [Paenibacillus sacheonensis]NBC72079.1 hypothetical protein [Paenibacillus sacheonensis]
MTVSLFRPNVRRLVSAALGSAMFLLLCIYFSAPAEASNTTYYVNNQSGSNCSDSGSGTSTSQPFCSFTPINNIGTFSSGDQILLARGSSYNQQMVVNGTGSSGNWITIGAYGSGARPIISRNSNESDRAIRLTNPDYWRIQDLEISNAGTGILVGFTNSGHQGLEFRNIYLHHIKGIHQGSGSGANTSSGDYIWNSAGIEITLKDGFTESPYWNQPVINNMLFDYISGDNNLDTIRIDWFGGGYSYVTSDIQRHDAATNVVMNHLDIRDNDQGGGTTGCDDSMAIKGVYGFTIMNSTFDEGGKCYSASGTASFILLFVKDGNFFNNVFTNVPNTGSPDQVAIDYEHSSVNINVNNNYFGNHAGAGPSILAFNSNIAGITNHLDNLHIDSNVMVNNGASIRIAGGGLTPNGRIGDNLYGDSTFMTIENGANAGSMNQTNNKSISASNIYHSGFQFSGTQGSNNWSYQSYNGSSWSNLSYYDSSAKAWQTNSSTSVPSVKQFEQAPGTSGKIARAWTAPSTGQISIRGRILKSDYSGGDGVTARITKNGTRIWPSGGDQSIGYNDKVGVEQVLDSISVNAGDVIRFEVDGSGNNTADTVSWSPAVGYTSFTSGGTAPSAPTGLSASGGNGQVSLSWSASGGATSYTVKRGTSSGSYGTTVASGVTSTSYTDTTVSNGTTYYYAVTATNSSGTSGNSGEASATPSSGGGGSYAKEWNFDTSGNLESWSLAHDVNGSVGSGSLHVNLTGTDPYIISPDSLNVSAANNHVYLRLQNSTDSQYLDVYFKRSGDGGFSETYKKTISISPNSGYNVYDIDMSTVSGWSGSTVNQLRLDVYANTGSLDFDYIKMGGATVSAPSAPTGLTASGGNAQVALSWTASSGASSYTVKRGTSSGTYGTTVASGVTSTNYTDTTVSNGTTYYYVVTATNSGGTSGNSGSASATPSSGSSYAKEWNFDTDGNQEGWSLGNQLTSSVSGGSLHLSSSGTDPYMFSSDNLGIAASGNGHVYVRLKNTSSSTGIQIYFITNSDTSYGESKVVNLPVTANSDYTVYDLNMSGNANWTGTIKQLRFDPANASGTIDVDYIKVGP